MAKLVTVKVLLALATHHKWYLVQFDVNNVFLNGDLFEKVYIDLPLDYGSKGENYVCRLHKSIYGLKQAFRQWYSKIFQTLIHFGFIQSKSDYSLFTKDFGTSFVALLVYVDDIIITRPSPQIIDSLKFFLHN